MWMELATATAIGTTAWYLLPKLGIKDGKSNLEVMFLDDQLDLEEISSDGCTVETKNGVYFRIYEITGINYDGTSLDEDARLAILRQDFWNELAQKECDARLFGIKRDVDLSYEAEWPTETLREIAASENRHYSKSAAIYWYIVISSSNMGQLELGHKKVFSRLSIYKPTLLRSTAKDCKITSFLNYLLCGEFLPQNMAVSKNLSANLQASNLNFARDGILNTYVLRKKYSTFVTFREVPNIIRGDFIQKILSLPGDVEISQVILTGNQDFKTLAYKRRKNELRVFNDDHSQPAIENAEIEQKLQEKSEAMLKTQSQIILRADSLEQLNALLNQLGIIMGPSRITSQVETFGAEDVWFSRIPGRDNIINEINMMNPAVAALWPWHKSSIGQISGPWGQKPVRLFRTPSGQGYSFQFHVPGLKEDQPLGNYLVLAPSGSGKSTLINYLQGGLAKFEGHKSYYFDSKEGAKFMIKASGGTYQTYDEIALNPLDVGGDTKRNRLRVKRFLETMLNIGDHKNKYGDEIAHFLDLAFSLEGEDRIFNELFDPAFGKDSDLRALMAPWVDTKDTSSGEYSHLFNAKHDSLSNLMDMSHLIGINMNEALEDPQIGPPLVMHIIHAIEKAAKSNRTGFNIFVDEGANLLGNHAFKKAIQVMYREYRKIGGSVGLAFQDPEALIESGIDKAIIENTSTMFFFPNRKADEKSLAKLGLTEDHIDFIKSPETDGEIDGQKKRQVLIIKQIDANGTLESAIVDVDLNVLGDCVRFFRAGDDANHHMDELQLKYGPEWLRHL